MTSRVEQTQIDGSLLASGRLDTGFAPLYELGQMFSDRKNQVILAAIVLLATAVSAFGQGAALGSISGRVSDPSQAPVPDATILIINTKTGLNYTAATTADGYYTVKFLPPGTYSVAISRGLEAASCCLIMSFIWSKGLISAGLVESTRMM